MKAPREYRNWVTQLHKWCGKHIPSFSFDNPWMEIKLETSKKNYKRRDKKRHIERDAD